MIYAIGDIHGHLDLLKSAHDAIASDRARHGLRAATVLHVGDLVDRGPDSAGVVEYLFELHQNEADYVTLKGNHDRMFTTFLRQAGAQDPCLRKDLTWLHPRLGGADTLLSYGITEAELADPRTALEAARRKVPEAHVAFLEALPDRADGPSQYFAHAGIRPGVPFDAQTEDDLLWIRAEFLEDPRAHPKPVIHGHTPVKTIENHGNRIAIDTGAAYGGPLSVVGLEGKDAFEVKPTGRANLPQIT